MKKVCFTFFLLFFISQTHAQGFRSELALLYSQNRTGEAVALCQEMIQTERGDTEHYLNLALLHEEEGRLKEAIALLQEAYNDFKDEEVLFHLGRLHLLLSQYKDSVSAFKKYISSGSEVKLAYFYLGLAFEAMGKQQDAIKYYLQARKKDPFFILPLLKLSQIYYAQGAHRSAQEYAQQVEEVDPSIKSSYKLRALSSFRIKDYLASFKHSGKFLNMVPGDEEIKLVHYQSKEALGESFFAQEREKTKESRLKREMSVASFVKKEGVPIKRTPS